MQTSVKTLGQKAALLGTSCAALLIAGTAPVSATPTYAFMQTLAIPGVASFSGYDLSVFDPTTQLYYLTDRSNSVVDVYNGATNKFVEGIGTGMFSGTQGGNNNIAGPNGISISDTTGGKLLLVGNTGSIVGSGATATGTGNVVAFTLDTTGTTVTTTRTISTASPTTPTPTLRVDGVAYSPTSNTILTANNASNPGFLTLINNANNTIIKTLLLNGSAPGIPNVADQGVEATVFNAAHNSFYIAVPTLNAAGVDPGGVLEVSAVDGSIIKTYSFAALGLSGTCSPTGLAQGAGTAVFIACSDPTAKGSVLLDTANGGSIKVVAGIEGGDQAYYDPTLNTFYEAARFEPNGPVLGIIDGTTLVLQTLAIGGNDHSVAVDPVNGEVYVATAATTAFPNCSGGCIGVFTPVPEPATLPVMATALVALAFTVRMSRGGRGNYFHGRG